LYGSSEECEIVGYGADLDVVIPDNAYKFLKLAAERLLRGGGGGDRGMNPVKSTILIWALQTGTQPKKTVPLPCGYDNSCRLRFPLEVV
jgi:hypothetical protein